MKKVPKSPLRNLLFEHFYCEVVQLDSVLPGIGANASGTIWEDRERRNALAWNRRQKKVSLLCRADAAALAAALVLCPALPEVQFRFRAEHTPQALCAHWAKTLDIDAERPVVHTDENAAARMAQAE